MRRGKRWKKQTRGERLATFCAIWIMCWPWLLWELFKKHSRLKWLDEIPANNSDPVKPPFSR